MDEEVKEFLQGLVIDSIHELYDDPGWIAGSSNDDIKAAFEMHKKAAECLGLDFDEVVEANSTQYERDRMAKIVGGSNG